MVFDQRHLHVCGKYHNATLPHCRAATLRRDARTHEAEHPRHEYRAGHRWHSNQDAAHAGIVGQASYNPSELRR
jgi:hypothetical protein